MKEKSKIFWFEPVVFLFFGLFHLHRVWALIDRIKYANFWLAVLNQRGILYFILMGILSALCIAGIIVFLRNIGNNYWWRWIYIFGGGYVLFDLICILVQYKLWYVLLGAMFDTTNIYWNYLWGLFIVMGILSLALGLFIIKIMKRSLSRHFR